MDRYPTDPAQRKSQREQVRRVRVKRAEQDAWLIVRSITCQSGHHEPDTTCSGALNCLCDCHDDTKEANRG